MKKIVIVVDDSKIVRNLISKVLTNYYEVLTATNGDEALELVAQNFDKDIIGVLLDLNMPEYDGFTVLEYFKLNNLFKKIPVCIISGEDSKDGIDRAFKYDIVDMLNKPFTTNNIINMINKMINFKQQK